MTSLKRDGSSEGRSAEEDRWSKRKIAKRSAALLLRIRLMSCLRERHSIGWLKRSTTREKKARLWKRVIEVEPDERILKAVRRDATLYTLSIIFIYSSVATAWRALSRRP